MVTRCLVVVVTLPLLARDIDPQGLIERVEREYHRPSTYYFEASDRIEDNSGAVVESTLMLAGDSAGRYRFELAGPRVFSAVNDGRNTWVYVPGNSRAKPVQAGGDAMTDARSRLLGIWASVTQWAENARFVRWETLRGVQSAVMEIRTPNGEMTAWIDPDRAVVLRSRETTPTGVRTTDYWRVGLNEELDAAMFSFESAIASPVDSADRVRIR